jgi:hypothetical protein
MYVSAKMRNALARLAKHRNVSEERVYEEFGRYIEDTRRFIVDWMAFPEIPKEGAFTHEQSA